MNNKSLFTIILFIFFIVFVNAQEYTIGLKGGINNYMIGELLHLGPNGGNNVTPTVDTYFAADKGMNIHYGIFLSINYDRFFIRPEIMQTSITNTYPLALKSSEWSASKIDIPLLFGYQLYDPFSIYLGPELSTISNMQLEGLEVDKTPLIYNQTMMNINVGFLVDFGSVGVDLRYAYSISKYEEQRIDIVRASYGTNVGYLQEYNPNQISLSVFINLFKIDGETKKKNVNSDWRNHNNLK